MKHKLPSSPFSTHLSAGRRDTEIRIQNIAGGKHRRPALPLLLLALIAILSCGGLVSCKYGPEPSASSASQAPQEDGSPLPVTEDTLPFSQPLSMIFSSGAGAWSTQIQLYPDGTFTGEFCDADLDTLYLCQFHGKFTNFTHQAEHTWAMTLEELTLDTGHPLGEEWDDGEFHCISSNPYGFDLPTGEPLLPGALFYLYTPGARGDAPDTELYGADALYSWYPDREHFAFRTPEDTLPCYALYNVEGEYAFFTFPEDLR